MRETYTDIQSIFSSSVCDTLSSSTAMNRGGASMTPLASSSIGAGEGGGSSNAGNNNSSSSSSVQHPLPFQNQQPTAALASQYNSVGAPAAVIQQQHQQGLSNSFAASSVSSSLAINSPVGGSFVGLPGANNLIGGNPGENSVKSGYYSFYGGSTLTTNANSTATAAPSVGAAAPSPYCCECSTAQNRCSTDLCPCFASRRMCDEHCESARYRGDCLNQAICKCSCEADPSKPAKNVCTKSERCDCLRIKEGCSKLCACKQICKNKEPTKKIAKINKPAQGCTCAKSKKQCVKKECPCRSVYEFCSSSCKCSGDCTNGPSKFHVPKHVQNCFLEHKHESSGLIVTLIGEDYIYRGDFYHESKSEPHVEEQLVAAIYDLISKYKIDLYEIIIFVSKSPCFHQDCDPKCEVVDECRSNKACAKLLGLLLSKVRKELSKVDVKMTVKFLYPHLNRGDLYTKQGILSMLQAGIKVEPLLMKDWSAVMDWSPHADHKGEYLQLWNNHNLDKSVAQSQSFINECRRALGLSMKFWVAEIHEIVKNTILHYSEIRVKCGDLNDALKQLDLTATPHKIRSTPSKRRSFIDMHELRDKLLLRGSSETRNKNGSNMSVASDDAHAQAMVASFCGRSFDDNETNEIAQRIRRATANINMEIETLLEFLTRKSTVT